MSATVKFEKVRNLEILKIELFTGGDNTTFWRFDYIVSFSYPYPKSRTAPARSSPMPPIANVIQMHRSAGVKTVGKPVEYPVFPSLSSADRAGSL